MVALVGDNGSGKTTLAKLLAGLYRPQAGYISRAGQDLSTVDIRHVRDRVAVLFQDFVNYYLPARENISTGRWERSDGEQAGQQAAARAGAQTFSRLFPAAMTPIWDRSSSVGVIFPGGNGSELL